ncbi:MAG: RNA-guided pseudouridylation complex pseudouridine synthase subunit Cbf5 [Thermoplasmatota archaeon]
MPERSGLLPADRPRKRLVRMASTTDPKHGKKPEERSIEELLALGVVPLDKPAGPTSHQVAAWMKGALEVERVGHGGTLDPNVTGALPVAIGGGPKVVRALLEAGKEYVAVMRLHEDRSEEQVLATARRFVGKIKQTPPVRSAVKRRPRIRRVYYLDVLEVSGRDVLFRVGCQAGTYIRNLCVDMARDMGTRGHMQELRRSRTGTFQENELVTLHDVLDARIHWQETGDEGPLRKCVLPVERVAAHMDAVVLRDSAIESVCHGAPLAAMGIAQADAGIEVGQPVQLLSLKGELVGIAQADMTTRQMLDAEKGIAARAGRVVMAKGTYPKVWKRR